MIEHKNDTPKTVKIGPGVFTTFAACLSLLLVVGKLAGLVSVTWLVALSPLLIDIGLTLVLAILVIVLGTIAATLDKR